MDEAELLFLLVAVLLIGPALGCIHGAVYGCLAIGCGLVLIVLLSMGYKIVMEFLKRREKDDT